MSESKPRRKRGRPLGFRLSDESKRAISESKLGHTHTEETKDKISSSLVKFYRDKYPLSNEMLEFYHRKLGEEAASWVATNYVELDELVDVITDRSLSNARRRELQFNSGFYRGNNNLSPDKLIDLKRVLKEFNIEVTDRDACDVILILVEEMGIHFILEDIKEVLRS